jgi:Tfp pilus assembly major pilin PilA
MHSRQLDSNRKSISEHSQTHFEFKRKRINSVEADTKFFSKLKELFKKISSPRENVTTHEFEINPEEYLTDDEKITIEINGPYSGSASPRLEEEETKNLLEPSPEINITNLEKEIKGKKTSDKLKCISEELGIRRCASQEAFGEITPRMEKEETSLAYKETENSLNGDRTYNVDEFSFQETETVYSKTNGEGTSSLLHSDSSTSWDNSFTEDHPVILKYLHSKPM